MKLIKTFILIVIVLTLVYFLMRNNDRVNVDLIFTEVNDASVAMVIFGSLAIGILLGYLFAIFSILSAKAEIRSMQNKNKRLSDELNDLRNVAIDEGIYDNDDGSFKIGLKSLNNIPFFGKFGYSVILSLRFIMTSLIRWDKIVLVHFYFKCCFI